MEVNKLEQNKEITNQIVQDKEQVRFLETSLGKSINLAVDIGIRALLPNLIEDQIINVKDNLINFGLNDGIKKTIQDSINFGKSAIGIFTGNFENMSQIQSAIGTRGIIEGVSEVLDKVLDKAKNKGLIKSNIVNTIKQGKNIILNNVEKNIEKSFKSQIENIDLLDKYEKNWSKYYESKDFNSMEKEFKKINKKLQEIVPLENTIKKARLIENLHNLIKNNGNNFNLSAEELELAQKLT